MSATLKDPRRYFEQVGPARAATAEAPPVCLYLEVTNRCNLLCETCPRTFEALEPPADMSWELFTRIVDQVPDIARVVLHGVGEPMLVRDLPRMIRYLKSRGTYVLFNTNGTLLRPAKFQELVDTGLDELRISLDAADRETYKLVRGKDFFDRIVRDVRKFTDYQKSIGSDTPRVSLWLTGLKETVQQLPEFVRLAARMGVREVHLQRLVFDEAGYGMARPESSLFESTRGEEMACIEAAQALGRELGVVARCIGRHRAGAEPQARAGRGAVVHLPAPVVADVFHRAWPRVALLHRAVFGARLRHLHAGRRHAAGSARDLERRRLSRFPPIAARRRAAETLPGLRLALEPVIRVAAIIPAWNEEGAIGPTVRRLPREVVDAVIVVDGGSRDRTAAEAREAGAEVLVETRRGYGRACASGADHARQLGAEIALFLDGDGADAAEEAGRLVGPIRAGSADFVLASRTSGAAREPGSMGAHQVIAGLLIGRAVGLLAGFRYADMCAFRAIRLDALERLGMREMTYGWNLEMQMRAARAGLRISEVPLPYRRRIAGDSKVAGNLRGTVKAGTRIVATLLRVATETRISSR